MGFVRGRLFSFERGRLRKMKEYAILEPLINLHREYGGGISS
jgi:hypothetical protein